MSNDTHPKDQSVTGSPKTYPTGDTHPSVKQLLFKLRTTREVEHNDNQWSTEFVYTLNDVIAAINDLRRADMEYVIGEDDPRQFKPGTHTNVTVRAENKLRVEQRTRMNERLGGKA